MVRDRRRHCPFSRTLHDDGHRFDDDIDRRDDGYDFAGSFVDSRRRCQSLAHGERLRPSGEYLMEDFYYAGGLRALLKEIGDLLALDCLTVSGATLGADLQSARVCNAEVIRSLDNPISAKGGTAILYGNLAPDGAVIKPTAAEPRLLKHTGPAVVFKDYKDMIRRVDDDQLVVDENSVLVLQNAGPEGGPGMPEWGMLPIPKRLLMKGVRDMVRISDARMSGTAYGACVLHVAPESFVGGPL